ncbi:hypothetical protein BUALT_Bualt09G0094900 [Buddleja alternifolia]|uniref:Uncharacterized protein n=1 Tax=Buddleja alternifolia TaxID=168488 RepID=A0AAV6X7W8_9LAMI|nr:hypothetical protein BUALT_Bualt09G0094900 [Buddleja alternifolia]
MASSDGFPAADVKKELNPGINKDFQVDPISADVTTSKEIKEQAEAAKRFKERQKKDAALQNFKTAIIVSGIVVAVAGAAFAITKKLREK